MATRTGKKGRDGGLIRRIWAWLTGTGYRPERHYMRGGREAVRLGHRGMVALAAEQR